MKLKTKALVCDRCNAEWQTKIGTDSRTQTCPNCHHNQPLTNEARAAQDAGRLKQAGMK